MKSNIKGNMFDGKDTVELNTTLGEAETLFAAKEQVQQISADGSLKALHDSCNNLSEASEASYLNMKDRLMGLINAGHGKEDEIFENLMEDHEITGIRKHHIYGESIFDMMSMTYKMASVENLSILGGVIDKAEDKTSLQMEEAKLVSLLGSKVRVLGKLVALQESCIANVEDDAANRKLLYDLQMDLQRCEGSFSRYEAVEETPASEALKD